MSKFMVLVYEDGVPKERHVLETPQITERGFYRQTVSLNAFSNREAEKLYDHHKKGEMDVKGKRCWVRWYDEFMRDLEFHQECFAKLAISFEHAFSDTPEFSHTSVWDFYNAIGYDYKKKRYLKAEQT